ncbi:MAG: carboxypeptidase-like regulatory domain-containing protein, partial [Candidatus Cryptobacteroides sp.]
MKKLVVVLSLISILCSIPASAKRQSELVSLYGKVLDSEDGDPIAWATVALLDGEENVIAGGSTDEEGIFLLKAEEGEYLLRCTFIGYEDHQQMVSLSGNVVEVAPIRLALSAQTLEGATVTERVKLVEMKIDKVVMNVSQSAFAQGSNALELMKKAPGVTIDKDGNVKLNGKSVSVWIDGRPSYLDGKALEAMLRSTNGESIDKFELMENPSSKYDAAGQGGIIN